MFSSTSTSSVHWFLFIRLIMEIVSIFFWLWKWPKHIIKIETTQKRGSWSVTWKHTRKHTQMQNREERFKSLLISRTYLPHTKQTSPSWKYVKFRCGSLVCLTISINQPVPIYCVNLWILGLFPFWTENMPQTPSIFLVSPFSSVHSYSFEMITPGIFYFIFSFFCLAKI